jgi:hypothetical protein
MAKVIDFQTDDLRQQAKRERARLKNLDARLEQLIRDIAKDRTQAAELAKLDVRQLSEGTKAKLMLMLARELRGQIPNALARSLLAGNTSTDILEQIAMRFANAMSQESRLGRAAHPAAARDLAADKSTPQQALRWTQFVQKALHVPGAKTQGRTGVASPKGVGITLLEILGGRAGNAGPGLRSPKLVERPLQELSPDRQARLMRATLGERMAAELAKAGIRDPLQMVRAGALPDGRAELALKLGLPPARLLGLLMRAEMLKIGPGQNGELGIRPEFLGPLHKAGIAMLGSLAVLRTRSPREIASIYMLLRRASSGFAHAVRGGPAVAKRDLIHWSRAASRRPSEIHLADVGERGPRFNQADAQELIQAWYLENLLWEKLANIRCQQEEIERQQQPEQRDDRGHRDHDEPDSMDDIDAELAYDDQRGDNLICFWISDFNVDPLQPGGIRRMYVCIDPDTGAIIPQHIEA